MKTIIVKEKQLNKLLQQTDFECGKCPLISKCKLSTLERARYGCKNLLLEYLTQGITADAVLDNEQVSDATDEIISKATGKTSEDAHINDVIEKIKKQNEKMFKTENIPTQVELAKANKEIRRLQKELDYKNAGIGDLTDKIAKLEKAPILYKEKLKEFLAKNIILCADCILHPNCEKSSAVATEYCIDNIFEFLTTKPGWLSKTEMDNLERDIKNGKRGFFSEHKNPCQIDPDSSCDGCKERMECGMGGSEGDVVIGGKTTFDGILATSKIPKSKTFYDITNKMCETYIKKNADYGDSFGRSVKDLGLIAAVVRMNDKMNRIKQLVVNKEQGKEQEVKDESIKDTLLDLANYAVMTLVEMGK